MRFAVIGSIEAAGAALWAAARPDCGYEIAVFQPARASFESYRRLLRSGEIDAVYLGVGGGRSLDYERAALGTGVHVLCDALPTASASEWEALARAARSRRRPAMLSWRTAHASVHLAATSLAASGHLGSLQGFSAVACTRRADISSLVLQCAHAARGLFGAEPEEVVGVTRSQTPPVLNIALRLPPDCLALIACAFDRDPCLRYDVMASDGGLRVLSAPGWSGADELLATVAGVPLERRYPRGSALGEELGRFARSLRAGALGLATHAAASALILDAIERACVGEHSARLEGRPLCAAPRRERVPGDASWTRATSS